MTATRRAAGLLGVVALGATVIGLGLRRSEELPRSADEEAVRERLEPVIDPGVAEAAFRRVEVFRGGGGGTRISLTADEITALLRHAVPGMLPAGVVEPVVHLEDGTIRVQARLASGEFAASGPLAAALGVLPDTIPVDLRGRLLSTPGRIAFRVDEAHASRVPLPRSAVAAIAATLAARADEGISADADDEPSLTLRWPAGVAFAEVVDDRLVLLRDEPNVDHAVDGSDAP